MYNLIPLLISGGSGTRLWPLSRKQRPKQFLPVIDDLTLFQSTLLRLQGITGIEQALIVCNESHRYMVAEQLRELNLENQGILLEPIGRNTAPAITLAALYLTQQNKDAHLLVLPADHVITNIELLYQAIESAKVVSSDGYLATFGIIPNAPETGYGYIRKGIAIDNDIFLVDAFVEKPNLVTAQQYLNSGNYLWNSGMFLFKASRYLEELEKYHPNILEVCGKSLPKFNNKEFIFINEKSFSECPNISIDYAVMEKTTSAAVLSLDAGWNDVGSWSAVWDVGQKDEDKNVLRGDTLLHNAHQNLVYTEQRLVALVGVDNLVVVDTKDATLVAHRDQVQDVKKIVEQLQVMQRSEATIHREVNRPWGSYDCIDHGQRFQVKRIIVKAGEKLSLQMHHHRAEHWIVVSGTAQVQCGDKTFLLTENQSTYIPLGEVHSLANPGKVPLEIIEVQSGSYLGEDDIVRFEDQYGRVN